MQFELHSTLPDTLPDILQGLLLLRKEQGDPDVVYTPHKITDTHCVFELRYKVPPLLLPFVGSRVVLREDIVHVPGTELRVNTRSDGSADRRPPFMSTEALFRWDGSATTCQVNVEWGLSMTLPKPVQKKLARFGRTLYDDTHRRQQAFIDRAKAAQT